jgi:hypothetical protein
MKTIGKCGFATAVVATVCFGALAPSATTAQSYPARTVSIVVPFGAGSITDGMARILADKLNPRRCVARWESKAASSGCGCAAPVPSRECAVYGQGTRQARWSAGCSDPGRR